MKSGNFEIVIIGTVVKLLKVYETPFKLVIYSPEHFDLNCTELEICAGAFERSHELMEVEICEGCTRIGENAFHNCYDLQKVTLPESLKTIEMNAFKDTDLKEITIPSGVKTIKEGTFAGCVNLTKVNFSEGLETIEDSAFRECAWLRELKFPESLKRIEDWAFAECKNIWDLDFPKTIEYIGAAFRDSWLLKRVEVPSTAEIFDESFYFSTKIDLYTERKPSDEWVVFGVNKLDPTDVLKLTSEEYRRLGGAGMLAKRYILGRAELRGMFFQKVQKRFKSSEEILAFCKAFEISETELILTKGEY